MVYGPYSGKEYGRKGMPVTLIAEHGLMAIVDNGTERFPVKMNKLSKKGVEQDPADTQVIKEEKPVYIKPAVRNKKSVTNPQNNIQSLF
jgi:hypothetical protein